MTTIIKNNIYFFYGLLVYFTYSILVNNFNNYGFLGLSTSFFIASFFIFLNVIKKNEFVYKSFDSLCLFRALSFAISQSLLINGIFISGISLGFSGNIIGIFFSIIFSKILIKEKISTNEIFIFILAVLSCFLITNNFNLPFLAFLSGFLQGLTLTLTKKIAKNEQKNDLSIFLSLFIFSIFLFFQSKLKNELINFNINFDIIFLGLISILTQYTYFRICEKYSSPIVGVITLSRIPWSIILNLNILSVTFFNIIGLLIFLLIIPILILYPFKKLI